VAWHERPGTPKSITQVRAHIIAFCKTLPTDSGSRRISDQLHDAANSVATNYRATCRARSPAEFIAKICITVEEADEAQGWLQTLIESGTASTTEAHRLLQESTELLKIFAASKRTSMRNQVTGQRSNGLDANRVIAKSLNHLITPMQSLNHPVTHSRNHQRQCAPFTGTPGNSASRAGGGSNRGAKP
jgi:four helix bundle protein